MGRVLVAQADQTVDLLFSYLERTRTPTAASRFPPARAEYNRALVAPRVPRVLAQPGAPPPPFGPFRPPASAQPRPPSGQSTRLLCPTPPAPPPPAHSAPPRVGARPSLRTPPALCCPRSYRYTTRKFPPEVAPADPSGCFRTASAASVRSASPKTPALSATATKLPSLQLGAAAPPPDELQDTARRPPAHALVAVH